MTSLRNIALALTLAVAAVAGPSGGLAAQLGALDLAALPLGSETEVVTFAGKRAVKMFEPTDTEKLVLIPLTLEGDGDIEVELAGAPMPGAPESVRGFVGVAFGIGDDPTRYEAFYIRANNGRAAEPVMRSRAVQYISMPDHPWRRLREEHPGVYESAADVGPNEWVKVRVELRGPEARVFVGAATTPNLTVQRLAHPGSKGRIALWVASGSDGYFSTVEMTPRQ